MLNNIFFNTDEVTSVDLIPDNIISDSGIGTLNLTINIDTFGSLGSGTQVSLAAAQALTSASNIGGSTVWYHRYSAGWHTLYRGIFDIEAIEGVLTSATITLSNPITLYTTRNAYLYSFTRDVTGDITLTDWDNYVTQISDKAIYDSINHQIIFTLNQDGLDYINNGGLSIMVRDEADVENDENNYQTDALASVYQVYTIDYAKETYNPLLFKGDYTQVVESGGLVSEVINQGGSLGNFLQTTAADQFTLEADGLKAVDGTEFMTLDSDINTRNVPELTFGGVFLIPPTSAFSATQNFPILGNRIRIGSDYDGFGIQAYYNFETSTVTISADFGSVDTSTRNLIDKNYTFDYFNANLAGRFISIYAVFDNGLASVFIESSLYDKKSFATSAISGGYAEIYLGKQIGSSAVTGLGVKNFLITEKALSATEIYNLSKIDVYSNSVFKGDYTDVVESGGLVSQLNNQSEYSRLGDLVQPISANQFLLEGDGLKAVEGDEFMTVASDMNTREVSELTFGGVFWLPDTSGLTKTRSLSIISNRDGVTPVYSGFSLHIYYNYTSQVVAIALATGSVNSTSTTITQFVVTFAGFDTNYANRWINLYGVFNRGKTRLYIDSVVKATFNLPTTVISGGLSELYLGKHPITNATGGLRIKKVLVEERALSATEMYLEYKNDLINYSYLNI